MAGGKGFVFDASVALAWCFHDEATAASAALLDRLALDEIAEVPAIWALEVANILVMAEKRKRLDAAAVAEFVALLETLDIRADDAPAARAFGEILALARREGLSSYDAAYLDLAMRRGLPLATRDAALAKAARRAGVAAIVC